MHHKGSLRIFSAGVCIGPLPCSCRVDPLAVSLRQEGASLQLRRMRKSPLGGDDVVLGWLLFVLDAAAAGCNPAKSLVRVSNVAPH
jgi:hypothetical protein